MLPRFCATIFGFSALVCGSAAWSQAITHLYFGVGGYETTYERDSNEQGVVAGDFSDTFRLTPVDDTDSGWRILYGYQFRKHFAVEGGYFSSGEFTQTGSREVLNFPVVDVFGDEFSVDFGGPATTTTEHQGFTLSGLATWSVTKRLSVKAKLGVAFLTVDSTVRWVDQLPEVDLGDVVLEAVDSRRSVSQTDSHLPIIVGANISYQVTRDWGLTVFAERMVDVEGGLFSDSADIDKLGAQLIYRY